MNYSVLKHALPEQLSGIATAPPEVHLRLEGSHLAIGASWAKAACTGGTNPKSKIKPEDCAARPRARAELLAFPGIPQAETSKQR